MADPGTAPTVRRTAPALRTSQHVQALPPLQRWVLRGAAAVAAAIEPAFGVTAPTTPCRATRSSDSSRAALWLGPDEWLLLAADPDAALPTALRQALAPLPHSLVDVSHRQIALAISGPQAALLLNSGCPLDLDRLAFPVGMCSRTVLAKAEIVLWRTQPDTFHVEVWRSFAAYLGAWLEEAARGLAA